MGCCLSKKNSSSSSSSPPINRSCVVKQPDPNKSAIPKPLKLVTQETQKKLDVEESKPKNEEESELQDNNNKPRKEVFMIKHRGSHEKSKTTTDPEDSTASDEKSISSNTNPIDVDAILIQCGRLSRSNSAAGKKRRYSGSKRSFDGDAEEADAEDGGEDEETERRIHRERHRGGESPRDRRRRTPSREREDSKSYRSGSRERGSGNGGGGSRRVSRSPGRRSEINNNANSCAGSGSSVNSNNNKPAKFVSVPATDKAISNNGDGSIKRITVKRNVGKIASPRSQSPARAATQPSPSKLSRKTDHSPYRRNPLGDIDTNSVALGSRNVNCNKKMMNRDNEGQGLVKESENFTNQKLNTKTAPIRRAASPNRAMKEQQEVVVEESKIVLSSGTELIKPQVMSRSRSLRKSRDFDFSPEALLSNNVDNINNIDSNNATAGSTVPSYTALLLEDIQNFHQKSVNVNNVNAISSSVSKSCSTVEAVADLNSSTKQQNLRTENSFTSAAVKKADLMEPSFEKYVTVKRGGSSLEDMEEQESSGSNSYTGSSCVVQRQGYSSASSWEPNSAESTDRVSLRSKKQERDKSPLGVNFEKEEFDPLKKNGVGVGRKRVAVVESSSSAKGVVLQATTTRVAAAVSM